MFTIQSETTRKAIYYFYWLIYGGVLIASVYFFFDFGGFDNFLNTLSNIIIALGGFPFSGQGQIWFYNTAPLLGWWGGFLLYLIIQLRLAYLSLYKKRLNLLYPLIFLSLYVYGINFGIDFLTAFR